MLAEANASPKEIAARLGHKKIALSMELYTHETEAMRKNVGEIFRNIMSKNADKQIPQPNNINGLRLF